MISFLRIISAIFFASLVLTIATSIFLGAEIAPSLPSGRNVFAAAVLVVHARLDARVAVRRPEHYRESVRSLRLAYADGIVGAGTGEPRRRTGLNCGTLR